MIAEYTDTQTATAPESIAQSSISAWDFSRNAFRTNANDYYATLKAQYNTAKAHLADITREMAQVRPFVTTRAAVTTIKASSNGHSATKQATSGTATWRLLAWFYGFKGESKSFQDGLKANPSFNSKIQDLLKNGYVLRVGRGMYEISPAGVLYYDEHNV